MCYSEETVIIFESTFPAIRHTRVSTTTKKDRKRLDFEVDKQEDERLWGPRLFHGPFTLNTETIFIVTPCMLSSLVI